MSDTKIRHAPRVRLGELIEEVYIPNIEGLCGVHDVRGVANTKGFIKTRANIDGRDLKCFCKIPPEFFAFNRRTTRNGERLGMGFNNTNRCYICTDDYIVFRLKESKRRFLCAPYLYLNFLCDEFDRYVRYDSWGSATEFFNWENICRVEIPLPSIEVQRELVAVYDGLQKIVAENEALIPPLEAACRGFLVDLKSKYPMQDLGIYIEECDTRNNDGALTLDDVRGVSIEKKFIATKANMEGVSLSPYKVMKSGWFCYVTVTSRNGDKISLALYDEKTPAIVSSSYVVFRSKDEEVLLPEYLYLYFCRPEFDRYTRFNSWGSARETFDFSEMKRVQIPVPPIEVQRSIAAVAHCLEEARRIVRDTRELVKKLCPALVQKAAHSA